MNISTGEEVVHHTNTNTDKDKTLLKQKSNQQHLGIGIGVMKSQSDNLFKFNMSKVKSKQVLSNDDMQFYDQFLSKITTENKTGEEGLIINMRPRNNIVSQTQSRNLLSFNSQYKAFDNNNNNNTSNALLKLQSFGGLHNKSDKLLSEEAKQQQHNNNNNNNDKFNHSHIKLGNESNNDKVKDVKGKSKKKCHYEYKNITIIPENTIIISDAKVNNIQQPQLPQFLCIQRIKTLEELSMNYNSEKSQDMGQEQRQRDDVNNHNNNNKQIPFALSSNDNVINSNIGNRAYINKANSKEQRHVIDKTDQLKQFSQLNMPNKKKRTLFCCIPIG